MKQSEIKSLLIVLNSTNDLGFKYPIGNPELTAKVRDLESNGLIYYEACYGRWSKGSASQVMSRKIKQHIQK
jgi:hypothetical protein